MKNVLLITCEHGGNEIPDAYKALFLEHQNLLSSHRGWDIGALSLFQAMVEKFSCQHFFTTNSRLLIDTNRSLLSRNLFSIITKPLEPAIKKTIIESYYLSYLKPIEIFINQTVAQNQRIIHLSVHTFSPQIGAQIRNNDVGLLFDPSRSLEKDFCRTFKKELNFMIPEFKIRFNYPYRGISDGLTTYLRRLFKSENYQGIELELNQKHCVDNQFTNTLITLFVQALEQTWIKTIH